jgi:hypothetical protein
VREITARRPCADVLSTHEKDELIVGADVQHEMFGYLSEIQHLAKVQDSFGARWDLRRGDPLRGP